MWDLTSRQRRKEGFSNFMVSISDDGEFGFVGHREIYIPTPKCELDMVKCLKKVWKHYMKTSSIFEDVIPYQFDEDYGWMNMGYDWMHEQWDHEMEKGVAETPFF